MNSKKLKFGGLALAAFVAAMGLSACAGENGADGQPGKDGVDGIAGEDGVDGKEGSSCTATALKDDSGYILSCGGEVVGSILNGKDGVQGIAGADGKSCSAAPNADASGYDISCDGKVVGTILNGMDGVDGNDGESCSATALVDGSGFTLTCGGEEIGTILNGTAGTSCSAALNVAKTGYTLTCGGEVVGTILNGTNGIDGADGKDGVDGTSCSATALVDGSGFTLVCGGKKVGVIKNGVDGADGIDGADGKDGVDGTSCSATALVDGSGFTLTCGGKKVGVIKNGVGDVDGIVSGSNENILVSLNAVMKNMKGVGFDAWYYGKDPKQPHRIITSAVDPTKYDGGYWWFIDDTHGNYEADVHFSWGPDGKTNVGSEFEIYDLIPVERACEGICGFIDQKEHGWGQFGVGIADDDRDGADVTEWLGLCVQYASSYTGDGIRLLLNAGASILGSYETARYQFILPQSSAKGDGAKVVNIPWSAFSETLWVPDDARLSLQTVIEHLQSIGFYFSATGKKESGYFHIYKLGAYGTCQ